MIFPQTAVYALRAMALLANLEPGASLRSRELAEVSGIPEHYVSKVLRRLVVAKLISSQKGHGGGFRLARAASTISFHEILAAVDVILESGKCVFDFRNCNAKQPCPLHDRWTELQALLVGWADNASLADARGGKV
jgi:Rrf2 family protein